MASFTRLTADQMETLSEIVFGLTITFSAIQFALNPPSHIAEILDLICEFAISFTFLVWVWITYIRIMRNLRKGDDPPVLLNVILLLLATVEPYLLYIVWLSTFQTPGQSAAEQLSSEVLAAAYAIDVGLVLVVLGMLARPPPTDPVRGPNPILKEAVRRYSNWLYGCAGAFFVTALPVFWILVYSASFADGTAGYFSPWVHLQLILWIPIFIALGVGSYHYGRGIDHVLDQGTPSAPGLAAMQPAESE